MLQLRWATVMIMLASPCTVSVSARITHVLHIGDNAGRDTCRRYRSAASRRIRPSSIRCSCSTALMFGLFHHMVGVLPTLDASLLFKYFLRGDRLGRYAHRAQLAPRGRTGGDLRHHPAGLVDRLFRPHPGAGSTSSGPYPPIQCHGRCGRTHFRAVDELRQMSAFGKIFRRRK